MDNCQKCGYPLVAQACDNGCQEPLIPHRYKFHIRHGSKCIELEADTPEDLHAICHNFGLILEIKRYDFAATFEVIQQQAVKEVIAGLPFEIRRAAAAP